MLNSLDVFGEGGRRGERGARDRERERVEPILGGSRHKSDRIFIDAKLAISSPVTIPELCISLGDSRFEVYPSRLFPPRSPTRSVLFHVESYSPFLYLLLLAPSPSTLASFSSSRLRNLSRRNVARLVSLAELRSFPFSGSYPSYPFSARTSLIGRAREEKETISTNPTITVNAHYNILMMS